MLTLGGLIIPRFILDLRPALSTAGPATWYSATHEHRLIGGNVSTQQFKRREVAREYDAIVWIDKTTATIELPLVFGKRSTK